MVKILIAGDFAPRNRVESLLEEQRFADIFAQVIPYTTESDYSVVNLEAPVVMEASSMPIEKCGPSLKCSINAVKAVKYAGFNMATLANNHFFDYGDSGVRDTLTACANEGIDVVGGGLNVSEASKTFIKEINGVKFAFINCCENEFSIATDQTAGSNPINPVRQFNAISEAKAVSDKIIVIVHGGPEGYRYPTPRMKELYRFYIDSGADAVINHHQHCYSGYEVYKEKPIFYGLGNFCFDSNKTQRTKWNEGYMVQLIFNESSVEYILIPYIQGLKMPGVELMSGEDLSSFESTIKDFNDIIHDDSKLLEKHKEFCEDSKDMYLVTLEPYSNKYLRYARFRKFIPSFLSKKRAYNILNYVICESHRERFQYALKNRCK